jgi:hypothetical protein
MSKALKGLLLVVAFGAYGCASFHDCCEPRLERPLLDKPLSISEHQAIYRFSWFRSFNEPYVVRIERTKRGAEATVRTVMNGRLEISQRHLSELEWKQFLEFVYNVGFWAAANPTIVKFQNEDLECQSRRTKLSLCEITVTADGASWTVESTHDGHYHWLSDNSPSSGALYELGLHMLQIADVRFHGPVY